VLSRLARVDVPLASVLPLLPRQAGCRSPLPHSRSPARAHPFPQRMWTTRWRKCQCWRDRFQPPRSARAATLGCPPRRCQPLAERGGRRPCARTSGFQEPPGRAAVSRPICPALRRQGRSVARAKGPRHHRPRLRPRTRRRGAASAASRPRKARARTDGSVGLSTQRLTDRSVQRLIPRRHWTAPAHGWAARPRSCPHRLGNALEQVRRLAHLAASQGAATCSCLRPAPIYV
jgi:hypothetical protein